MKITALGLCAAVFSVAVLAFLIFPRTSRSGVRVETPSNIGGMTIEEVDGNAVALAAAEIARENFADYGIMPIAEKAYTLTATVNDDATVKAVDWTVEFEDPASEWATGKTVTDYVSFTSKEDLTATVACSQAFGEPILVSAVSRDDPTVKATCRCDYQKQIVGTYFNAESDVPEHSISQESAPIGSNLGKIYFGETYSLHGFCVTPVFGVGTRDVGPKSYWTKLAFSIPMEAAAEIVKKGFIQHGIGQNEVTIDIGANSMKFDDDAGFAFFGPGFITDRLALVNAIKALNGSYPNLVKMTVTFAVIGSSYEGPTSFDFYFDIDADSLYTAVSDVQVNESNLLF